MISHAVPFRNVCRSPQTLGSSDSFNVSRFQECKKRFCIPDRPGKASNVHRIGTHAASVFLEGDRALKIKHTVCFPYLDYETEGRLR